MPSRVLFTFPGKIGDALHQWPIARQWAEENDTKIEVGLARQIAALKPLFEAQPLVSEVHLLDGVQHFDNGGQPWDFGWGTEKREWDEAFHLGFRSFPARGLMRETYDLVPLKASFEEVWSQPSIEPFWQGPVGNIPLVLHGTKSRPSYYKALIKCWPLIAKTFDPIFWAGKPDEWPQPAEFKGDGLPLIEVAAHVSKCALVFAASSSIAALAGAQGAPCLRIGEPHLTPNSIWDNPGTLQYSTDKDPVKALERIVRERPLVGDCTGVEVRGCRACGGNVHAALDLGDQPLSGVFPLPGQEVPHGPLVLGQCSKADCGLMQLTHSFPQELMYGDNYGYRTGLNPSMASHVREVATYFLPGVTHLSQDDVVVDIGSNDGTLLAAMPSRCKRFGVDPTIGKFKPYYLEDVEAVPEFFPSNALLEKLGGRKAKIVTSVAMFYDVDDPVGFAKSVREIIRDDGVWFVELAYLPLMLENTAFDVICHEHACYYGLRQLKRIADEAGFHIHNLWLNDTNGGSLAVAMTPNPKQGQAASYMVNTLIEAERRMDMGGFIRRVSDLRGKLAPFLRTLGSGVIGLGASTKGNVLLHACGIGPEHVSAVVDVNGYKWGRLTSTGIPIISPEMGDALQATHHLVLPWHFREHFLARHKGQRLIFPLPRLEVVEAGEEWKHSVV